MDGDELRRRMNWRGGEIVKGRQWYVAGELLTDEWRIWVMHRFDHKPGGWDVFVAADLLIEEVRRALQRGEAVRSHDVWMTKAPAH